MSSSGKRHDGTAILEWIGIVLLLVGLMGCHSSTQPSGDSKNHEAWPSVNDPPSSSPVRTSSTVSVPPETATGTGNPEESTGTAAAIPTPTPSSGSTARESESYSEEGNASWYGEEWQGTTTASGETFDMNEMTAAHPKLAFGTKVRVTNLRNNKSVEVRINDHFPGGKNRVIDLSKGAFGKIAPLDAGVVPVRVEVIEWSKIGRRHFRK